MESSSRRNDSACNCWYFACLCPKSSDDFQRTQRWRPGAADIAAFGDARIAALHAGLKLTAEQEKLWPPVEAALRDLAKQRSERFAARANAEGPKDPIETA